jgi:hypothetical protein
MYLIRKRGNKQKAHIWNGEDTACRMWSTGGLKKELFVIDETSLGKDICVMCLNNNKKLV